jgi:hypothetical protein
MEREDVQLDPTDAGGESDMDLNEEFDGESDDENEADIDHQDMIYPILTLPKDAINPATRKRWTIAEKNKALQKHIEERWTAEFPMEYPVEPYLYTPFQTPGPAGMEIDSVSVFMRFISINIAELIVTSSNRYANSDKYKSRRARESEYATRPLTVNEFYRWCAMLLLVSLHNKADYKDNWSRKPLLYCNAFSENMALDRYIFICSILHTCPHEENDPNDTLWKCRNFITLLNKNFYESWVPDKEISVDESLMMYKGHHSLIRYIPNKSAK